MSPDIELDGTTKGHVYTQVLFLTLLSACFLSGQKAHLETEKERTRGGKETKDRGGAEQRERDEEDTVGRTPVCV